MTSSGLRVAAVVVVVLAGSWIALGTPGFPVDDATSCQSGYGLDIELLGAEEPAPPSFERFAFQNLSGDEQRVFLDILNAEETQYYDSPEPFGELGSSVVTYRGDRYRVSTPWVAECPV